MVKTQHYLLFVCLILCGCFLKAQTQNPFDLTHRLPKTKIDSLSVIKQTNFNIFDIPNKQEIKSETVRSYKIGTSQKNALKYTSTPVYFQDLFWIYIIAFFFLTMISAVSREVFKRIFEGIFNLKNFKVYFREAINFYLMPLIMLYFFWLFNLALFIYFIGHFYTINLFAGSEKFQIISIFACVTIIYALKHLMWYLVSKLFTLEKTLDQYHFMIIKYNIVVGLILFLINLIIGYIPLQFVPILLSFGLIAIASIFIYRIIIGLLVGGYYIFKTIFQFLLYLCTVEIAPFVFLLKYLLIKTGL